MTVRMQRVKGTNAPGKRKRGQQLARLGNLIGFFADGYLGPDFLTRVGEARKQMGSISLRRSGSPQGFAIDGKWLGRRSVTARPHPARENLFDAGGIKLRQEPSIERATGRQKQARAEQLA